MNSNGIQVGIEIKAIPDGFIGEGTDRKMLLSLVVMPVPPRSDGVGQTVQLEKWPQLIQQAAASITVHTRTLKVGGPGTATPNGGEVIKTGIPDGEDRLAALNAAWNEMLGLCDPSQHAAAKEVFKAVAKNAAPTREEGAFNGIIMTYPVADLARVYTSLQGSLAALQVARHLNADDANLQKLTKALNPKSGAAQQSDVIKLQLGLNETVSVRDWVAANIPTIPGPSKPLHNEFAGQWTADALRRIAWTGRERPPAPKHLGKLDSSYDADDVHVPQSLAHNLLNHLNHGAALRDVFLRLRKTASDGISKSISTQGKPNTQKYFDEAIKKFSSYYNSLESNFRRGRNPVDESCNMDLSLMSILL
ncbi:MAG: hypothetical protein AB7V46_02630, partial [Thermomicrobiales bacterium]